MNDSNRATEVALTGSPPRPAGMRIDVAFNQYLQYLVEGSNLAVIVGPASDVGPERPFRGRDYG